jgi:nitrogen fixation protein NifU and related proteins
VTAFRQVVLEHFRHPRNRGALDQANGSAEGANPLCGDRIRVQVRVEAGAIIEARFVADACAICVATASLLTERTRGMRVDAAALLDAAFVHQLLEGEPPPGRRKCATLPLDTLHRAVEAAT